MRHIECRRLLFGSNKAAGVVLFTEQEFYLKVENLFLLLITYSLVVLGLLEEALSSLDEIILTDTPLILEHVEDVAFVVEDFNGTLLGDVLQSDNTVGDATALDDADPSNLRSIIGVSSTTGFGVYSSDIYYSQGVSRNNTTLVKSVAILFFGLGLVHESFGDLVTFVNKSVGLVLDVHLLLFGQAHEVGDIQVSFVGSFLSSSLPNVGSQYLAARSKD